MGSVNRVFSFCNLLPGGGNFEVPGCQIPLYPLPCPIVVELDIDKYNTGGMLIWHI